MSEERPAVVLAYTIVACVSLIIGGCVATSDLLRPIAAPLTIADFMLAYLPLLLVAVGVAGMWFMRWWAVALFWLLIATAIVGSLLVPFPGPSEGFLPALVVNASILIAVIALPPTLIAVLHRRRFR